MSRKPLEATENASLLATHPLWTREGEAIVRRFEFGDFRRAWAFMSGVALAAEKLDHHPEWSNVYGRVEVRLSTHDAGGLTALDFQLAEIMDGLA